MHAGVDAYLYILLPCFMKKQMCFCICTLLMFLSFDGKQIVLLCT